MFRIPRPINNLRTESDDYSDVSDTETDQQQRPARRTTQHSPTKRRKATKGKSLSTCSNNFGDHINQQQNPVGRQIGYQSTPLSTNNPIGRSASTLQPQTLVSSAHSAPQPSQIVRPQALQHNSQRARPAIQVSQSNRQTFGQGTNNFSGQQNSNMFGGIPHPTMSTHIQAPSMAHTVQSSQEHAHTYQSYLPRTVPTATSYNTQAPVAPAPSLPAPQMSTNGYVVNTSAIPSIPIHRPSPLNQHNPTVSNHNVYIQPLAAYNIPMASS